MFLSAHMCIYMNGWHSSMQPSLIQWRRTNATSILWQYFHMLRSSEYSNLYVFFHYHSSLLHLHCCFNVSTPLSSSCDCRPVSRGLWGITRVQSSIRQWARGHAGRKRIKCSTFDLSGFQLMCVCMHVCKCLWIRCPLDTTHMRITCWSAAVTRSSRYADAGHASHGIKVDPDGVLRKSIVDLAFKGIPALPIYTYMDAVQTNIYIYICVYTCDAEKEMCSPIRLLGRPKNLLSQLNINMSATRQVPDHT